MNISVVMLLAWLEGYSIIEILTAWGVVALLLIILTVVLNIIKDRF